MSSIHTVAVISPGEMGSAVGRRLREGGLRVVTALDQRGEISRKRAADAGIEDAGSLAQAVAEADVLLAILPPGRALGLARAVGRNPRPIYVDCNAISPATVREISAVVGERFVDAGIIGMPGAPRFYVSGPLSAVISELPLDVRDLGGDIGQASGLKMCYAALTKGLTALLTESTTTAAALGVSEALQAELADSQPQFLAGAQALPRMVPKAYRWVAEMEEIAATFAAAGLTPRMLQGAADVYRLVEASRSARDEPIESLDALVDALLHRPPSRGRLSAVASARPALPNTPGDAGRRAGEGPTPSAR
jgi:3-hydroxyisobutyrate dehydrogenase-like beta-hydroxyacid dehydrogenase